MTLDVARLEDWVEELSNEDLRTVIDVVRAEKKRRGHIKKGVLAERTKRIIERLQEPNPNISALAAEFGVSRQRIYAIRKEHVR